MIDLGKVDKDEVKRDQKVEDKVRLKIQFHLIKAFGSTKKRDRHAKHQLLEGKKKRT